MLRLDPVHLEQPLLVLGVDPRDHLDVRLQAGAAQLRGQQLVHLEDAVRIDPDFALSWYWLGWSYALGQNMLPPEQTGDFDTLENEASAKAMALAPDMRILTGLRASDLASGTARDILGVERLLEEDVRQYGADADANLRLGSFAVRTGDGLNRERSIKKARIAALGQFERRSNWKKEDALQIKYTD